MDRKKFTIWSTYSLVALVVLYAVIGFAGAEKSIGQIAALTVTLGIFSWLLSESLEMYLEHRRQNNWRKHSALVLGIFLLAIEIHLVHFGMGWLLPELSVPLLYIASAGFSGMTVFAKATFGYSYPDVETVMEPSVLADTVESVSGPYFPHSVNA